MSTYFNIVPNDVVVTKPSIGTWQQTGSEVIPNDESFEKLWGMNHFGGRDARRCYGGCRKALVETQFFNWWLWPYVHQMAGY